MLDWFPDRRLARPSTHATRQMCHHFHGTGRARPIIAGSGCPRLAVLSKPWRDAHESGLITATKLPCSSSEAVRRGKLAGGVIRRNCIEQASRYFGTRARWLDGSRMADAAIWLKTPAACRSSQMVHNSPRPTAGRSKLEVFPRIDFGLSPRSTKWSSQWTNCDSHSHHLPVPRPRGTQAPPAQCETCCRTGASPRSGVGLDPSPELPGGSSLCSQWSQAAADKPIFRARNNARGLPLKKGGARPTVTGRRSTV